MIEKFEVCAETDFNLAPKAIDSVIDGNSMFICRPQVREAALSSAEEVSV